MFETLNICVYTTATELPFSNGLKEHHNLIFSEMLDKVLQNKNMNFRLALAWCSNAKDSLANDPGIFSRLFLLLVNSKN